MVKTVVKATLAAPPIWKLTAFARAKGCVVLTYHRIVDRNGRFPGMPVEIFRAHMEWLRANCRVIGPDELKASTSGRTGDRPAVFVTFDDGYRDYYELAYPILESLDLPATNFLSTDFIDRPRPFWWDLLYAAASASRKDRVALPWAPGASYALDRPGRDALVRDAKTYIKRQAATGADDAVASILAALDVREDVLDIPRQTMTWDEVRTSMRLTSFGGHTHTHVLMAKTPPDRLRQEIRICRERLQAETGIEPPLFAYPSGSFDEAAKAAVRAGGFEIAFSTIGGINRGTTDWFEVRRIYPPRSVPALAWKIASTAASFR